MVKLYVLSLALVIHRVEANHRLQEGVEGTIRIRVYGHLKQWREYVVDHVREHAHLQANIYKRRVVHCFDTWEFRNVNSMTAFRDVFHQHMKRFAGTTGRNQLVGQI